MRAATRARPAGGAVDDLEARPACRRAADSLHPRAGLVEDRERLFVATRRRSGATGRSRPRSSPRPSTGCRCRRRSAGRAGRRRSARVGSSVAQPPQDAPPRRAPARGCPGRGRRAPVEAGAAVGHQLQHRAVDLRDELARRALMISHVLRGRRPVRRRAPATSRSSAGGSGSTRPFSKRMKRCLPWASTLVTAWPSGVRASGRARSAGAASRCCPGTWPSGPAGSCSLRSGWCRPRARLLSMVRAATMPARARTVRGASPGVPWGEHVDLRRASRARRRCSAQCAHARREPSGGVVAASDARAREVAACSPPRSSAGEWELGRAGAAGAARARGRRAWLRRSRSRCSRPITGRRSTARASSPPTSRSSSTSCRARRAPPRVLREPHVPPRDGLRALAGPADRHGRRSGRLPRSGSGRARVVRRRARARTGGRRRAVAPLPLHAACRARPGRRGCIEAPKPRLKALQRRVLHEILDFDPGAPRPRTGSCGGRSARTHAAAHVGRRVVVRLDLEDFFAGVTAARVFGIFRAAGYPEARRPRAHRACAPTSCRREESVPATGGSRAGSRPRTCRRARPPRPPWRTSPPSRSTAA